ncbi:MAG TPA: hypothetical protein VFA07_17115 [Chthonomonadaceae bacterium]|nr:hypothetical protein [Chthonomonadaceae bacterium]
MTNFHAKTKAHVVQIFLMWSFYLFVPLTATFHIEDHFCYLPASIYLSFISFSVAVWLLFQKSKADILNGGLMILLDMVAGIVLICSQLHAHTLQHATRLLVNH